MAGLVTRKSGIPDFRTFILATRARPSCAPSTSCLSCLRHGRRGCLRRQVYAACARLAASAGMTAERVPQA